MDDITYFYKQSCPFSKMTHVVMAQQFGGSRIKKICVDDNVNGYKQHLSRICQKEIKTFPQIFINNRHVGGYTDLINRVNRHSEF